MLPQVWANIPQKDVTIIPYYNNLKIGNEKINVLEFSALITDGRNSLALL